MKKFLYLFRGGDARNVNQSPAEMEAHMDRWKSWMGQLAGQGKLVDGLPLSGEGMTVEGTNKVVSNGPFAEGSEIVGGYLMVNAADISEAVELSKGCPILEFKDGNIEVREILSM